MYSLNNSLNTEINPAIATAAAKMSKRRIEIEGTTLGPNAAKLAKPVRSTDER